MQEDKVFEVLHNFKVFKDDTEWSHSITKENTSLYSKYVDDNKLPHYMVKTVIDKDFDELADKMWKPTYEKFKEYDKNITSLKIIEEGEHWKVISVTSSPGLIIKDRQFVYLQTKITEGDIVYLVLFSVDSDLVAESDKYVRGKMNMSVYEYAS